MIKHYLAVALRNVRGAPFTSAVNVLTLAVGLICFVTASAFVTFWGSAEQHFPKWRDIYVLTLTIKNREGSSGLGGIDNATHVPGVAAEFLRSDYPAITKMARLVQLDRQTMVATGERAERLSAVAVDPEFLDMFDLPFVAGDSRSAFASPRSVVLTREYATRLFGADNPIGKTLLVGNSVD
ncbi:MAG TPA: ABC transporter permease, partial [Gammaproteobacteria bacterium]|nr:ABC transporter permease [Gammaproteobacteria bacterium]